MDNKRIVVALDAPDMNAAMALAARLDPRLCRVKVGKELFTAAGPAVVAALHERGFEVFLDLKFHDIPNTVAGAARAWGVMLNCTRRRQAMLRAGADRSSPVVPQPP